MNALPGNPPAGSRRAPGGEAERFYLRNPRGMSGLLLLFVFASIPAALAGIWAAGLDWLAMSADLHAGSWRQQLLAAVGMLPSTSHVVAFIAGLTFFVPLLAVALLTSIAWELVFARTRQRPVDPGWVMASWLFVLLLPPATPLLLAAAGMSFGAVIGKHVFGGTGRYIASPAAVGALFLHFAYPAIAPDGTSWSTVAALGAVQASAQGIDFPALFFGHERGMLGTVSAFAAVVGALWLAFTGVASFRTLGGGLLGFLLAGGLAIALGGTIPPHWHFALGNAAFCWAFLLTDPTTLPLTRSGRWLHGFTFGGLVVLMREADPARPEGSLFAVLLAALLVPLLDYVTIRAARRRGTLALAR